MMREDVADLEHLSLDSLGICRSSDAYGRQQLTIDVDLGQAADVAQRQVLFNPETKRWGLVPSTHATIVKRSVVTYSPKPITHLQNCKRPPSSGSTSWLDDLPLTTYIEYFKSVDWASTSLGPLPNWCSSLQLLAKILLTDSVAAVIYWGQERVGIYNELMLDIAEGRLRKSSNLMGAPFDCAWPELTAEFSPMFENVALTKKALNVPNVSLFPTRHGFSEETFFSGSILPLWGESGNVDGFFHRAGETTTETIRERRSTTLNTIATTPDATLKSVWHHVFRAFGDNARDFPFAFAYSAEENASTDQCVLVMQQSLGVPSGHPSVPDRLDLYEGKEGFPSLFRNAKAANRPVLLHQADGSLPDGLLDGFTWRGFGDAPRSIVIFSISSGDRFSGLVVAGLNPRRPYDSEYEHFITNLARQVSTTIASVVDLEEAQKREVRLARQLEDREKQIRDMAEYAPVGMCRIAINGLITWANPQFYDISGHQKDAANHYELSFVDIVLEEDQATSAGLWPVLLEKRQKVSVELRMKRKWKPPTGPDDKDGPIEEHAWILALAYPIVENGEVKSIAGCITDISTLKWAESVQAQSAVAANEARKLIERHVDLTSHEIRNPLSAITQCADGISTSLEELESADRSNLTETAVELVKSNADAAKTILLCASHQKRIIDDVLTLSKLESTMLSITPVAVQPFAVVESAMKMFDAEFLSNDIDVQTRRETSYEFVNWVMLDPSRMTQIFVNLLTNAIKFTRMEDTRHIVIKYGATRTAPPAVDGVHWFPTDELKRDLTTNPEWGSGEVIYMYFVVQDTGRGLEQEEMVRLFNRFQQAGPRTHVDYGGSGLGLFISRQLTELQGGEIGVKSKSGEGSTFAFYIKGRDAMPPDEPTFDGPINPLPKPLKRSSAVPINTPAASAQKIAPFKSGYCVLLVEDNVVNAKVLTKQLQKAGCKVYVANHGVEALDHLQRTPVWRDCTKPEAPEPDIVLMDVEMPVMDGLTCTRRIRQLELDGSLKRHIDIIAITANARQEQIDSTRAAGMDDVMPKPFRVVELLSKMQDLKARGGKTP